MAMLGGLHDVAGIILSLTSIIDIFLRDFSNQFTETVNIL